MPESKTPIGLIDQEWQWLPLYSWPSEQCRCATVRQSTVNVVATVTAPFRMRANFPDNSLPCYKSSSSPRSLLPVAGEAAPSRCVVLRPGRLKNGIRQETLEYSFA